MTHPMLYGLFSGISKLRSVGEKRIAPFKKLHIENIRDLIYHRPISHIDRRNSPPIPEIANDDIVTLLVNVIGHIPGTRNTNQPFTVECVNDTGNISLLYFKTGMTAIEKLFPIRKKVVVSGRVRNNRGVIDMVHPDIVAPEERFEAIKSIEPVYDATKMLSTKIIAFIIRNGLQQTPTLPEWIPQDIIDKYGWKTWKESLYELHYPKLPQFTNAIHRLAFDEIFAQQLCLKLLRKNIKANDKTPVVFTGELRNKLIDSLPFTLTDSQIRVINELSTEQNSSSRMFRLLQGDVGSGKTIVAISIMLNAVEAGSQAAIMVPSEVLAMQHFEKISKLLASLEIRIELLIGSMAQSIKNKIQQKLIDGEIDIIVGTHALFQEKVSFKNLKLVVIDEQHRFGVNQRVALVQKGEMADLLMMTATPIPRTLSIVNYGDMDVSIMNEKPAFRQDIKTTIIKFSQLDVLAQRVEAVIAKGDKVYWVCPLINESDKVNLSNIMKRYEYLQAQFGDEVAIMHGKMGTVEREQNMKLFQEGKAKILLATTVIEVGVDDPNATIMIIENAERFGLSQLHQLRGRVGRGSKPSYCVLVSNFAKNSAPVARLNVLTESNDGFYISEKDLEIRGSGDMLGTRQSGMLEFRMFNPIANQRIAMLAAETATNITNNITSFEELSQELKILLSLFSLEQFTLKKDKLS